MDRPGARHAKLLPVTTRSSYSKITGRITRLWVVLGVCISLVGTQGGHLEGQTVRGQVVDSTTAEPLAGAIIYLLGPDSSQLGSTVTDDEGLFLVKPTRPGRLRLRVEHAGYRASVFPAFDVGSSETQSFVLLVTATSPSSSRQMLGSIIEQICPGIGPLQPVVAGWVRDSAGGGVSNAGAIFSWSNVPEFLGEQVSTSDFSGATVVDSTGFYAICGLPIQTTISLRAEAPGAFSDLHRLRFSADGVDVDGELSTMIDRVWVQDLTVIDSTNHRGVVIGTVTDAATGQRIDGAEVAVFGTSFTTTTDATGVFRLPGLPSGQAQLVVRSVGSEPLRRQVELPDNEVMELPEGMLALSPVITQLAPLVVEATAPISALEEFNLRRVRGAGSFLTREEFVRQGNPLRATDVLRRMQGIRIEASPNTVREWAISMRRGGPRTFGFAAGGNGDASGASCPPLFFLDRQLIGTAATIDIDQVLAVTDVEAIEAHGSSASMPTEFNRRGAQCGVIAFWTRRAPPRAVSVDSGSKFVNSTLFHAAFAVLAVVGIFFALGQKIYF